MQEHEYAVINGFNRAKIGQLIGFVAAATSSLLVTLVLWGAEAAEMLGYKVPTVVIWPITSGLTFAALYWIFDNYFWKAKKVSAALKVPDLSGKWICEGQSLNPDRSPAHAWQGEVVIVQSWDKLRVRLVTPTSGSDSISGSLVHDKAEGYRLMYSYRNDPRADAAPDMHKHMGYANLLITPDLQLAEGEYFNGLGRFTFGTMKLRRAK